MNFKILVAEDEEITLKHLVNILKREGYDVSGAKNGREALDELAHNYYDVLITDIKMPEMDGIELLERSKEINPDIEVLIITGFGSIGSAVEAMKKGAYEYITKPFDLDELILKVKNIHERRVLKKENVALKAFFGMNKGVSIIAGSDSMQKILGLIENIKDSDCNVLLSGESGVGKSLLAKIIHFTGRRHNMPFLSINCATLTEDLLASELFGHERGAFTGAVKTKQGLVEIADSGTLFLDEIAEMSSSLQAKLLKVIEDREFFRVGGIKPIKVDVRFIAATNRNVRNAVSEGRFREDLYYRLAVVKIELPPLRRRMEDMEELINFFVGKYARIYGKRVKGLDKEAMDAFGKYSWPGNIRQLATSIERAVLLNDSGEITYDEVKAEFRPKEIKSEADFDIPDGGLDFERLEHGLILKAMEKSGGIATKAAKLLGMSYKTFIYRLEKIKTR